jgi:hypothetical protein
MNALFFAASKASPKLAGSLLKYSTSFPLALHKLTSAAGGGASRASMPSRPA